MNEQVAQADRLVEAVARAMIDASEFCFDAIGKGNYTQLAQAAIAAVIAQATSGEAVERAEREMLTTESNVATLKWSRESVKAAIAAALTGGQ